MKNSVKRIASIVLAALMTVLLFTAMFAVPTSADVKFTSVNLGDMTYLNAGQDSWSLAEDTDGAIILKRSTLSNTIALSKVSLEAGKAYTIEVKFRYSEAYTNNTDSSRSVGLLFGSTEANPWASGGSSYCAMIDRGNAKQSARIFGKNVVGTTIVSKVVTPSENIPEVMNTPNTWYTLRVTISAENIVSMYVNGNLIGESSDETGFYNGGYIGVLCHGVVSPIEFRDLCYTEGVTLEPADLSVAGAKTHNVTVHYVYEDNTKAAEDIVKDCAEDTVYNVLSPEIAGYTPDNAVISGTMGLLDVDVTVVYKKQYNLTIKYVDAAGNTIYDSFVNDKILAGTEYSVITVPYRHHTADATTVAGVMEAADKEITVTYTPNNYILTVKYVFADGSEAVEAHTESLVYGSDYTVATPAVEGFKADLETVTGTGIEENTEVIVTYTAIETESTDKTEAPETTTVAPEEKGCSGFVGTATAVIFLITTFSTAIIIKRK